MVDAAGDAELRVYCTLPITASSTSVVSAIVIKHALAIDVAHTQVLAANQGTNRFDGNCNCTDVVDVDVDAQFVAFACLCTAYSLLKIYNFMNLPSMPRAFDSFLSLALAVRRCAAAALASRSLGCAGGRGKSGRKAVSIEASGE